jgi:hypothetical protein
LFGQNLQRLLFEWAGIAACTSQYRRLFRSPVNFRDQILSLPLQCCTVASIQWTTSVNFDVNQIALTAALQACVTMVIPARATSVTPHSPNSSAWREHADVYTWVSVSSLTTICFVKMDWNLGTLRGHIRGKQSQTPCAQLLYRCNRGEFFLQVSVRNRSGWNCGLSQACTVLSL